MIGKQIDHGKWSMSIRVPTFTRTQSVKKYMIYSERVRKSCRVNFHTTVFNCRTDMTENTRIARIVRRFRVRARGSGLSSGFASGSIGTVGVKQ